MLKTIQNLCYKNSVQYNMTSPFLVDNILHQQKGAANFQNQLDYVLRRQQAAGSRNSRENSPENEDKNGEDYEETRKTDEDNQKIDDDDSKASNEDDSGYVKTEAGYYRSGDYYKGYDNDEPRPEKEVLNIPNLVRSCSNCGSYDCTPFVCKKSGLRRLEELEKRFNLHRFQENSGDESGDNVTRTEERKGYSTDEIVRSCEEFSTDAPKSKPLLKFSVSAILGDRAESSAKSNGVNGTI
ncbi:hypothetical protein EVAR_77456_1 [Eumeta japonica]|uniref:Uncharacterized protein n=1 Tax=Eumeta variegata TaxID=151549 RepID=A0A4C1ZX97_EUMVA|nr:hypothetical protein EVAR_77456_1 [Eumeta japonica]